jgi:cation transport regulator ChaB
VEYRLPAAEKALSGLANVTQTFYCHIRWFLGFHRYYKYFSRPSFFYGTTSNMPRPVFRQLPPNQLEAFAALVARAKDQQYKTLSDKERGQGVDEATKDVESEGVHAAVRKAFVAQWADPLGQYPLGYILRLEEMRKMEEKGKGPWCEDRKAPFAIAAAQSHNEGQKATVTTKD